MSVRPLHRAALARPKCRPVILWMAIANAHKFVWRKKGARYDQAPLTYPSDSRGGSATTCASDAFVTIAIHHILSSSDLGQAISSAWAPETVIVKG